MKYLIVMTLLVITSHDATARPGVGQGHFSIATAATPDPTPTPNPPTLMPGPYDAVRYVMPCESRTPCPFELEVPGGNCDPACCKDSFGVCRSKPTE